MNAGRAPSVAKKWTKEINELMASQMEHFKMSGCPKRKKLRFKAMPVDAALMQGYNLRLKLQLIVFLKSTVSNDLNN